jgi:CHAD domain-containing protein
MAENRGSEGATTSLTPQRSTTHRAKRTLARAASDRRLLAGAAATAGAALAAGVAREIMSRDHGDDGADPARAYRIRRDEKAAEAVRRIFTGRLDDALEQLRERLDDDVAGAIHETRKDLKKARAVLRLVRTRMDDDVYCRENMRLRDAARALAGMRDAEVKVGTIEALEERFGDELHVGMVELRLDLEAERDAAADSDSAIRTAARQAGEAIEAVRGSAESWSFSKSGWKLLEPGVERSYARGRNRFSDVRSEPSPVNIHEWRKRVKDLWYGLRLLRDSWPEVVGEMGAGAHDLSDLLGDHHDLTVLGEDIRRRDRFAAHGDDLAAIMSVIEGRQEELLEAAVPVGERLYAESPANFRKRMRAYWRAWR